MPESSRHHAEYSEKELPLVSIVTVNYQQTLLTELMLRSLQRISYPSVEIFVVDNGSGDQSIQQILSEFPEVKLIMSPRNLGFAGGNNLAFPHCRGSYILLLNNDTEVDPGFLEPLVESLEKNPTIGIVSPKIFFFDEPDRLQFAGASQMHPITLRGRKFGFRERDKACYNQEQEIGFPNGACMMFRRSILSEIGYLYEPFFLYYEEHDWVERARRTGHRILFQPASRIWHKVSASTGAESPLKAHYLHRNRLVFIRRNRTGIIGVLARGYFWLIATPRTLWKYRSHREHRQSVWQSILWHARHPVRLPEQPPVQPISPIAI